MKMRKKLKKQANSYTSNIIGESSSGYTSKIDDIIYGSYVKMHRLDSIVSETFTNTSIHYATAVNIFIDLYSVLHQIFSRSYRTDVSNPLDITSTLINMCGHYRKYFRSKGVATRFFLIFSSNTHEINRKLVYGYNATFVDKYSIQLFNKIANNNFDLLDMLCPYLPDIHFIHSRSGYEVAVIIAYLIEEFGTNIPNVIISKDLYPLQLCTKYPYTSYLFPMKTYNNGTTIDESIMVPLTEKPSHNIAFWNLVAMRRKLRPEMLYDIDTSNFVLFEALHKFPERDIKMMNGITNISQTRKYIVDYLGGNTGTIDISSLQYNDITSSLPYTVIESRYNALNVNYMLPYYRLDKESQDIKIQNLDDNGVINNINAKYFVQNPINIGDL